MKNNGLRAYINKSGLSSKWIAKRLGISERQAQRYLSGASVLPSDKLFNLSDALNISLDELRELIER